MALTIKEFTDLVVRTANDNGFKLVAVACSQKPDMTVIICNDDVGITPYPMRAVAKLVEKEMHKHTNPESFDPMMKSN